MAILDEDEGYIIRLMEYFNQKKDFLFHTVVFSNQESYVLYAREHEVEILLCKEGFLSHSELSSLSHNLCLLTEKEKGKRTEDYPTVFKFQSAENIISDIMRIYSIEKASEGLSCHGASARILGIASPCGGTWCSTLSVCLAYFLGKREKTLFISFDPFFAGRTFRMDSESFGVTESIYFFRQNSELMCSKAAELIGSSEGFDYLAGCGHWADFLEIEQGEEEVFFKKLITLYQYENLVIDIGGFHRASTHLLKCCDKIFVPELGRAAEKEKHREWKRQYELCSKDEISLIQYLSPPYDEKIARGGIGMEGVAQGVFGAFVKELADSILAVY